MTKKRFLYIFGVMFAILFSVACVFTTACGSKSDDDEKDTTPEHEHSYTVLVQGDDSGHYYTCADDDGAKGEVTPHTYETVEVTKEATCGEAGTESVKCSVCGYESTREIPATGEHTYDLDNPEWTWTVDGESVIAKLTFACENCDYEWSDTATATATENDNEYTATIKGPDGEDYTKTYPLTGNEHVHDYVAGNWEWGTDEESGEVTCTRTSTCSVEGCDQPTKVDEAEVEYEVTTASTCTTQGTGTYTATFEGNPVDITEKTVALDLAPHTYPTESEVWAWTPDETDDTQMTAAVTLTCSECNHSETYTATVEYDEQNDEYTAAYTDAAGVEHTDTYEVVEVTLTLDVDGEEGFKLTATDGQATGTVTATVTGSNDTPTATVAEGVTEITASVAADTDEKTTYTITITATAVVENATVTVSVGDVTETFTVTVREASVTMTVNKIAMNLTAVNATDTSVVTLTDEWGETYSNGEITVTPSIDDGTIASAQYDSGLTVTALATGTATITVTATQNGTEIGTATIYVSVVISSLSAEDEGTYTATYKPVVAEDWTSENKSGSFNTEYDEYTDDEEIEEATITFEATASSFLTKDSSKSTKDNSATYKDYVEIKNSGSKDITVTIGAGVTAEIVVYVSHTSTAARTAYISEKNEEDTWDTLVGQTVDSASGDTTYLWALTATDLSEGTYNIFTSGSSDTMHVYAVVVTYKYDVAEEGGGTSNDLILSYVIEDYWPNGWENGASFSKKMWYNFDDITAGGGSTYEPTSEPKGTLSYLTGSTDASAGSIVSGSNYGVYGDIQYNRGLQPANAGVSDGSYIGSTSNRNYWIVDLSAYAGTTATITVYATGNNGPSIWVSKKVDTSDATDSYPTNSDGHTIDPISVTVDCTENPTMYMYTSGIGIFWRIDITVVDGLDYVTDTQDSESEGTVMSYVIEDYWPEGGTLTSKAYYNFANMTVGEGSTYEAESAPSGILTYLTGSGGASSTDTIVHGSNYGEYGGRTYSYGLQPPSKGIKTNETLGTTNRCYWIVDLSAYAGTTAQITVYASGSNGPNIWVSNKVDTDDTTDAHATNTDAHTIDPITVEVDCEENPTMYMYTSGSGIFWRIDITIM